MKSVVLSFPQKRLLNILAKEDKEGLFELVVSKVMKLAEGPSEG